MNVFHFCLSIFLYYNVLILNLQGVICSKMNIENEVTSKIASHMYEMLFAKGIIRVYTGYTL